MKKLMIAAAFVLLTIPTMAQSEWQTPDKPVCLSEDTYRTKVIEEFGEVFFVNRFTGKQAQAFITAFNELPPSSSMKGKRVIVFGKSGKNAVLVAFFGSSCMANRGFLQDHVYEELIVAMGEKRAHHL